MVGTDRSQRCASSRWSMPINARAARSCAAVIMQIGPNAPFRNPIYIVLNSTFDMSSIISIYTRDDNSYPFGDGVDVGEHHARATAGAVRPRDLRLEGRHPPKFPGRLCA